MILVVTVDVQHVSGRFVGLDEVGQLIIEAIQEADLSGLGDEGESEYEVASADYESGVNVRRAIRRTRAQGGPGAPLT